MARPKKNPAAVAPPTTRAELLERFKDYPGIQAWERAYENPDGVGSVPILLEDEAVDACTNTEHQSQLKIGATVCPKCKQPARLWYTRWVNTKQIGRVAAIRAKGLIPVQLDEVQKSRLDEIADLHDSGDGLVRSGQTGHRILYKIPLDLYNERKRRERDHREGRTRSQRRIMEDLANEAGHRLGSEAGDAIHSGAVFVDESFKAHRSKLEDEATQDE